MLIVGPGATPGGGARGAARHPPPLGFASLRAPFQRHLLAAPP